MVKSLSDGRTLRVLEREDQAVLAQFLRSQAHRCLPLYSRFCKAGFPSEKTKYIGLFESDKSILLAVLALSSDGLAMICSPNPLLTEPLATLWRDDEAYKATGIMGAREDLEALIELMGGAHLPFRLNNTERIIRLTPAQFTPLRTNSHTSCMTRYALPADRDLLFKWRMGELQEAAKLEIKPSTTLYIQEMLDQALREDRLAILTDTGCPMATAEVVQRLPAISQFAHFYVSPTARRKGYALQLLSDLCAAEFDRGCEEVILIGAYTQSAFLQACTPLGFNFANDIGCILFAPPVKP